VCKPAQSKLPRFLVRAEQLKPNQAWPPRQHLQGLNKDHKSLWALGCPHLPHIANLHLAGLDLRAASAGGD
jgi:hypothetical protein